MFLHVSVILLTGGVCTRGVPAPGGSGPGGCLLGGGLVPGGCLLRGGLVLGVPGGVPPPMATAAGSTHPTGMHSCWEKKFVWYPPPPTATAAGGTHPTGMHSCRKKNLCGK